MNISKISFKFKFICAISLIVFCLQSSWAGLNSDFYFEKSFLETPNDIQEKLEKKINFNFNKTQLSEVLLLIAKIGDFNIVFAKELDREISLKIKDQSIKEVLEDIALIYDYDYEFKKNSVVFINRSIKQELKLIPLKYLSAKLVLDLLNSQDHKNISISKDPGLNNLLLSGNSDEIKSVEKFIEKIDIAPKQKVFLPEHLSYKDIQRFIKYRVPDKDDIEIKRLEPNYILLSGKENIVTAVFEDLEKIDLPIKQQAFEISLYKFTEAIKESFEKLDPDYRAKKLFRANINKLTLQQSDLINSQTLKAKNKLATNVFSYDFEFSRDILDQKISELNFNNKSLYFNNSLDYAIYFLDYEDIKNNLELKKEFALNKGEEIFICIKNIKEKP